MSAIELHVCDTIISLNARSLLEPSLDVLINCTEDSNLALENLLVTAHLHLAGDVVDEAFLAGSSNTFSHSVRGALKSSGLIWLKEGDCLP